MRDLGTGRLMVSGEFSDLAVHHHPAVQVTLGRTGPLTITTDGVASHRCRLAVVGSGARHAVRSEAGSGAVTVYFGLQTPQGAELNELSRTLGRPRGIWLVPDGVELATATIGLATHADPRAATDFLVAELCRRAEPDGRMPSVHPQLRQAIEVVANRVPDHVDVASVAGAVALSPDYLGRLCRQQAGVSLSAAIRWQRLVTAVTQLADGVSVTDAAHRAGFADGSHATRVCREMTGAAPRDFAQAIRAAI